MKVALQTNVIKRKGAQEQIQELLKIRTEAKRAAADHKDEIAELREGLISLEIVLEDAQEKEAALETQIVELQKINQDLLQQIKGKGAHICEVSPLPKSASSQKKKGRLKEEATPQKKHESTEEFSERWAAEFAAKFRAAMKEE